MLLWLMNMEFAGGSPTELWTEQTIGTATWTEQTIGTATWTEQEIVRLSTNVALQSEDFATTWSTNALVTANAGTDPHGTQTADKIEDDSAISVDSVQQIVTVADDSSDWTASLFVHKTDHSGYVCAIDMQFSGGSGVLRRLFFNPTTGAARQGPSSLAPASYGVIETESHWRVWLRDANNGSGNTSCVLTIYPAVNNDISSNDSDATLQGYIMAWGAQLENQSSPSGYIATTTTAVTSSTASYPAGTGVRALWSEQVVN